MPDVSIVIPVLNEGAAIAKRLRDLHTWLESVGARGGTEIVVVDGGSEDDTVAQARVCCDRLAESDAGRARQMNIGAAAATGRVLWFLHVDSNVAGLPLEPVIGLPDERWGFFDAAIDDNARIFRLIETTMSLRARVTSIATGDQGIFVSRKLFERVGGFPDVALMEDIEISRRLRRCSQPLVSRARIKTSSRRWRRHGIARTIVLMWSLRLAWWAGVPSTTLARLYGYPEAANSHLARS